jgi:hypothetical protein
MRLGRELRYRTLPIVGTHLVIESLDDVDHMLRQLVTPWITADPTWDGSDVRATLAKYGLLDRRCPVSARQLEGSMPGIEALRLNGWGPGEPDPDPDVEAEVRAFGEASIVDLASSLGEPVLKIFLNDHLPDDIRVGHDRVRGPLELLPGYFPCAFTVTDACITNAPSIWIGKHFYL